MAPDMAGLVDIELVVTAPAQWAQTLAYRTGCRTTIGAIVQLVASAQREVLIAAPFIQRGLGGSGQIDAALRSALERGVRIRIVSTSRGLQSFGFAGWPSRRPGQLKFFQPAANARDARQVGSHAKFCVVDREQAYIGSANLTGPGMGGHIEAGVLVRGDVAASLQDFWETCLECDLFQEIVV
jgi:phosphatidylserine/phosphatidylglycerophosphate/cardiolipin synthase-like enzyme